MARNRVDLPEPGRAGDQHALARAQRDVVRRRPAAAPCGSRTSEVVDLDRIRRRSRSHHLDRRLDCCGRLRLLGRDIEAVEPRDHRAPFRELPVGSDEKRQRGLHAVERGRRLHQPAELNRAGEIGGADHDEGKHHRDLRIARGQEGQPLGALHDQEPVGHDLAEAVEQPLALRLLAAEQRDLLGILPHPHEIEAEIGLEPLLAEIERHQRPADQMRQRGSDHRVEQRRPDQVSRESTKVVPNRWSGAADDSVHRITTNEPQRDDGAEQPDAERQRALDEKLDVLGDALVGIVGRVAEQLHAVVVGAAEPAVEILPRSSIAASGSAAID